MKRCAVLALCLLAAPVGAEAKQPTVAQAKRAIHVYVERLADSYQPAVWRSTWVAACERDAPVEPTACGYGLQGTKGGEPYNCAGVADVHYRRGRPFGWRSLFPTKVAGGRRYRIVPELSFECWGPDSPITRIGY